jgi:glycosyltransferase involved in cell wall biosynthesis
VAWARGGSVEQIVDGVTGHLVPFDDLDRLFTCIDELVRSPTAREAMGRAGREWVSSRFSPAQLARALDDAYRAILPAERGERTPSR